MNMTASMPSMRKNLLLWLCACLALGLLLAALLVYRQSLAQANEIFDYQMAQLSASLPNAPFSPLPDQRELPQGERDIVIQIWDGSGLRIYRSHAHSDLPQRAELGFADIATPEGVFRVYSAQQGGTIVQVAQPLSVRSRLATNMAFKTVLPLLLLFPLLGIAIWVTVGRALAPVRRTAADVLSRDAASLAPVSAEGLPEEIRPLTSALNDLLARLGQAIDIQRHFVADAAHELRTPLTALKLQIQLAERAVGEAERAAAFAELRRGFARAMHMVQQLLTLARQEPGALAPERAPVDLSKLAQAVVAELAALAAAREIDLGLSGTTAVTVPGDAAALRILLENLVDNAIRYTPVGGRIDVLVELNTQGVLLVVQDNGPGIPQADLARVFDRFHRVPGSAAEGSGLGLAIARQITLTHGASISLSNLEPGLRVEVQFPAGAANLPG